MDDNRLKGLTAFVGLGLVCTVGAGAVIGSDSAAHDLRPKAVEALSAAGIADVEVDFDGREAKLSGGASSERRKAISVVRGINGVRRARFTGVGQVAPPLAPTGIISAPVLKLSRSDIGATISGIVPSAEVAASLKTAAAVAFGGTVSGDFTIDPSVGSADWLAAIPEVFGDLAGVKNLEIGVGDDPSIQLGGSIESQVGADRIEGLVSGAVPDLTVDSAITVDAGTLDSGDANTLNSATLYFGRGSASLSGINTATLRRVVDVLKRNAGINVEVDGHAGPADPVKGKVLSSARVAAVRAYLVWAGIGADRVAAKSFSSGERTNADAFAKQYRRVDFVVEEG